MIFSWLIRKVAKMAQISLLIEIYGSWWVEHVLRKVIWKEDGDYD